MGLTRIAALLILAGGLLVVVGTALVYPPAAIILAGLGLGALGIEELLRSR